LGFGVDRQEEDCRKLCADRGWTVAGVYVDNDISAADPKKKRPEYQRLLKDIQSGQIDAVVVWDEDRLHRQPRELEEFVTVCETAGMTTLASVGGDTDLNDDNALFMLRIKGAMAAQEVAKIRKRIQRQKLESAEKGLDSGGGRPFGFESDRVTINDDEAVLIREAATRVLEGSTLYSIRNDWTERGITSVTGKKWSYTALKTMLIRPRTAGLRQHQGTVVGDASWEPILDRATWEQVCTVLTDPSRRQPPPSRDYPLRGILKCSECGSFLSSIPAKSRRHYGCKKDVGGCGHVFITGKHVEDFVFSMVLDMADSEGMRGELRSQQAGDLEQAQRLVLDNAKDEQKLAELDDLFGDSKIPRSMYLKQRHRLDTRIINRHEQLSALRGQSALDRLGGNLRTHWADMSADEKRVIVLTVADSVLVSRSTRRGSNVFDPSRVNIRVRSEAFSKWLGVIEPDRIPAGWPVAS